MKSMRKCCEFFNKIAELFNNCLWQPSSFSSLLTHQNHSIDIFPNAYSHFKHFPSCWQCACVCMFATYLHIYEVSSWLFLPFCQCLNQMTLSLSDLLWHWRHLRVNGRVEHKLLRQWRYLDCWNVLWARNDLFKISWLPINFFLLDYIEWNSQVLFCFYHFVWK